MIQGDLKSVSFMSCYPFQFDKLLCPKSFINTILEILDRGLDIYGAVHELWFSYQRKV